ncbi:MAG TPA: type II toxin-antitoxin system prevent-host-death family antitoxin [Anaerolineae bacterium]|nr:type II toxin-antitoxin system prevent-host-death family antitoxin [Anaerolineae bacterium]
MEIISYMRARSNLAKTMEKVIRDHTPLLITRKNKDAVVLISLADYEAMEETAYLLQSPKNAQRLLESILELENGGGREREPLE